MTFPTHITIPYPAPIGELTVPIAEATMQQAIDWMNLSPSFTERLERRFILKQYIGVHCNLRLPGRPDLIIIDDIQERS